MLVSSEFSGELSYLDVVPCGELTPLANPGPLRVERLAASLSQDRILRHPLVTTRIAGRRVVLDGNSRLAAAIQIGLPDILVQELPPESIPDPLIVPALGAFGVAKEEVTAAVEHILAHPFAVEPASLRLHIRGADSWGIGSDQASPGRIWQVFRRVVAALRGVSDVYPVDHGKTFESGESWPEGATAILVPPPLTREALTHLIENEQRLPWGVVDPPASRRILGINLSLDILSASEPSKEKAAFVRELVRLRLSERRVRYYEAPVFIFEE